MMARPGTLERHRHRLRLPVAALQATAASTWSSISGATGSTYAPVLEDEGARVRVYVSGHRPRRDRERRQRRRRPGRHGAADQHRRAVGHRHPLSVGATLTASVGSWDPAAETFTYSWQRAYGSGGFQAIPGATRSTYTVAAERPRRQDPGDRHRHQPRRHRRRHQSAHGRNRGGAAGRGCPGPTPTAPAPAAYVGRKPQRPAPSPCRRFRAVAASAPR